MLPLNKNEQWTALLGVEGTSPLDAGRFTCRVRDWGAEQCRSLDVQVLSPPRPTVRPVVHTARRGQNVTTRCTYTGGERLGITWVCNKALVGLNPGKEVEEDLEYPRGSLLRLYNVQVGRAGRAARAPAEFSFQSCPFLTILFKSIIFIPLNIFHSIFKNLFPFLLFREFEDFWR